MSGLISKRELYHKLGEAYKKGYLSWGANEIIKDIIGKCDSVENKGEWIPVSERLPKIADVYRVTRCYPNNVMNPNYLVDACFFDGSNTWYNDNRINHERAYVDNVIAWQENPEPYEKDGE